MDTPANKHVFFKFVKFKEAKTFQITMGGGLLREKVLLGTWKENGKIGSTAAARKGLDGLTTFMDNIL